MENTVQFWFQDEDLHQTSEGCLELQGKCEFIVHKRDDFRKMLDTFKFKC